jgi:hypothetical protein
MLQKLRWVSNWGRVDQEQIVTIRREIKARNYDLIIDANEENEPDNEETV